jgi:hypothetical protein
MGGNEGKYKPGRKERESNCGREVYYGATFQHGAKVLKDWIT